MGIVSIILITSVCIVAAAAITTLIVIFFKIRKKRKEINQSQIEITQRISNNEGEIKMREREDFGQPNEELQKILGSTINHEIVEFCINSCIRNDYKEILLIGNVDVYEVITLSNKANANIEVLRNDFNNEKYEQIKLNNEIVKHKLKIIESIDPNKKYDSIMCLNSTEYFDKLFNKYEKLLRKNGMFIFANTKSNRKDLKLLVKEIEYYGYRYDVINWYTGFVTIVK